MNREKSTLSGEGKDQGRMTTTGVRHIMFEAFKRRLHERRFGYEQRGFGAVFQMIAKKLIAPFRDIGGFGAMGAKYFPTIKDLKANQRFQQKQNPLPKFKKSSDAKPAPKIKKK